MNEQEMQAIVDESEALIEKSLDIINNNAVVVKNNKWLLLGVGVLGTAVGATVSYLVTKKYALHLMEEVLEEELEKSRVYHERLYKTGEFATPKDALAALVPEDELSAEAAEALRAPYERTSDEGKTDYTQAAKSKKKKLKVVEVTEEEMEQDGEAADEVRALTRNVFVNNQEIVDGDWDFPRSEDEPFPISEDEFFESAGGVYEPMQMTYYSMDKVLTDAGDDIVDPEDGVGAKSLELFGKVPGDPNVLYIKNELLKRVYEIAYSDGSYRHEVAGYEYTEEEVRMRTRKLRGDDD